MKDVTYPLEAVAPAPTVLKATGARVSSVDEEGEVTLFCYSLHRSFSFKAQSAKAWGARLGDFVTITVTAEKYDGADPFWEPSP